MSNTANFDGLKKIVWDAIPSLKNSYDTISNLDTKINSITFDSSNQLYQFFGSIRYLTGDVIYTVTFGIISLTVSFYIFRMLKKFANYFIDAFTPLDLKLP
ncbi:MAG: hypothetical protein J6M02_05725 [Clostridia bacterium]|nr:hypothetical protein [Clostridia bacterium]